MEKNHRHPGRDGGGKRSLECVWNNPKYSRPAAPINNAAGFDARTAPQSPAFATFLAAHREIIAPLAMLGRRLDKGVVTPEHAAEAALAIIELYAP